MQSEVVEAAVEVEPLGSLSVAWAVVAVAALVREVVARELAEVAMVMAVEDRARAVVEKDLVVEVKEGEATDRVVALQVVANVVVMTVVVVMAREEVMRATVAEDMGKVVAAKVVAVTATDLTETVAASVEVGAGTRVKAVAVTALAAVAMAKEAEVRAKANQVAAVVSEETAMAPQGGGSVVVVRVAAVRARVAVVKVSAVAETVEVDKERVRMATEEVIPEKGEEVTVRAAAVKGGGRLDWAVGAMEMVGALAKGGAEMTVMVAAALVEVETEKVVERWARVEGAELVVGAMDRVAQPARVEAATTEVEARELAEGTKGTEEREMAAAAKARVVERMDAAEVTTETAAVEMAGVGMARVEGRMEKAVGTRVTAAQAAQAAQAEMWVATEAAAVSRALSHSSDTRPLIGQPQKTARRLRVSHCRHERPQRKPRQWSLLAPIHRLVALGLTECHYSQPSRSSMPPAVATAMPAYCRWSLSIQQRCHCTQLPPQPQLRPAALARPSSTRP